ncbi:MAG: nitroreductase family protein [Bacteroidales bacterium]|nr:nitroreductase family protein [Bacteroidales bacterium]MCB9013756.1 nitroreductase family protein [Bacteroidales bacterium]
MIQTIDENIKNRKSIFAFSDKMVEDSKLNLIFDAARRAPSSFNAQPWRYIYARKGEESYDILYNLLMDGNKIWASTAPVLILGFTEVIDSKRGRSNRFAFHDLGMATAMLMLQATSSGLSTHPMGGYDTVKAKEVFGIPSGFEPGAMIALGYEGSTENLPEDLKKRHNAPRLRKNITEFAFHGKWLSETGS